MRPQWPWAGRAFESRDLGRALRCFQVPFLRHQNKRVLAAILLRLNLRYSDAQITNLLIPIISTLIPVINTLIPITRALTAMEPRPLRLNLRCIEAHRRTKRRLHGALRLPLGAALRFLLRCGAVGNV